MGFILSHWVWSTKEDHFNWAQSWSLIYPTKYIDSATDPPFPTTLNEVILPIIWSFHFCLWEGGALLGRISQLLGDEGILDEKVIRLLVGLSCMILDLIHWPLLLCSYFFLALHEIGPPPSRRACSQPISYLRNQKVEVDRCGFVFVHTKLQDERLKKHSSPAKQTSHYQFAGTTFQKFPAYVNDL